MRDLISRQAAIKAILDLQDCYNGFSDTYDKACIVGVLEEIPSAEPTKTCEYWDNESNFCALYRPSAERPKSKWLRTDAYPHRIYCSVCYKTYIRNDELLERLDFPMNYCPNCGAEMERE